MTNHRDDLLLKAGSFDDAVRPLLELEGDLQLSAAEHQALLDAEGLLRAARADAEQIRQSAREEGLAIGLSQIADLLAEAERQRAETLRTARDDIAVLAVATARKLVGRALSRDPDRVVDLVQSALEEAAAARRVRVLVAPMTDDRLRAARERLARERPDAALVVDIDDALQPGDCRIETELGVVDARLDVQFETLLRALLAGEST